MLHFWEGAREEISFFALGCECFHVTCVYLFVILEICRYTFTSLTGYLLEEIHSLFQPFASVQVSTVSQT